MITILAIYATCKRSYSAAEVNRGAQTVPEPIQNVSTYPQEQAVSKMIQIKLFIPIVVGINRPQYHF